MLFEPVKLGDQKARIAVVGIGGAGGNALNRMIVSGLESVEFIAVNTDAQDLDENNSQIKMQIGRELTKGENITQLNFEHYPKMAEKKLEEISHTYLMDNFSNKTIQ